MKEYLEYNVPDLLPEFDTVLRQQGIPKDKIPDERTVDLVYQAITMFGELCEPIGVVDDIEIEEFEKIYEGEGLNEPETPVSEIFPRADNLALFALTVGEEVSEKISELFREHDFALASMLDAVASEATELAGVITEGDYFNNLIGDKLRIRESQILRYSPGYCGWHISGQKRLFEYLEPEDIGITLTDSYLMRPIKSISGVMIVGPAEIHNFAISYKFCDTCKTRECRDRIRRLYKNA